MCLIGKFNDLTGKKYGRLTVIELDHRNKDSKAYWKSKCECGNIVITRGDCLLSGNTKSCGCLSKELSTKRLIRALTKHGDSGTRLYRTWKNMKDRCSAFDKDRGKRYADIGIVVCKEWEDFETFKYWAINNGYKSNLTIDRKDVKGNYCPSNCRWITIQEQQRNRETSIFLEFNGEVKHLKEWAEILNIKYHTLYHRYKKNKNAEYVLRPYRHGNKTL